MSELSASRVDILLEMHRYNAGLGQAYLEYRERLTQVVMYIYAALFSLIFALSLNVVALPFAILIVVVSTFSEAFVLKFYERSEYHFARARALRKQLDAEAGSASKPLEEIFQEAQESHLSQFKIKNRPGWERRVLQANVHERWASLHRIFNTTGAIFIVLILANFSLCSFQDVCLSKEKGLEQLMKFLSTIGQLSSPK